MLSHLDISDDEFEKKFQGGGFAPSLFTHEAHLRLAWIHIRKYGVDKAIENITQQIRSFATSIGEADKYNHTLTIAAIYVVRHFMNKAATDSFAGLIEEFPRLQSNFRELVAQHYQADIYHSEIAKREYVAPDLLPFS